MTKSILAWHILPESRKLGYGDGRKVIAGRKLTVDCDPVLCSSGLHASVKLLDALNYARNPIVCRVRLGGTVVRGNDKIVATERTCLWMVDATRLLREFACWCAERALKAQRERGKEPDPSSWKAIEVARLFNAGKATREQLSEARDAADAADAATSATSATSAAYAAADAADAATSAAYAAYAADAATSAAYAAYAADAAASAARSAEREAQNKKLEAMVTAEHRRLARRRGRK